MTNLLQVCNKVGDIVIIWFHRYKRDFNPYSATNHELIVAYLAIAGYGIYPTWYLDSGTTKYCTNNLNNLHIGIKCKGNEQLVVGNCQSLFISYIGYTTLPTFHI